MVFSTFVLTRVCIYIYSLSQWPGIFSSCEVTRTNNIYIIYLFISDIYINELIEEFSSYVGWLYVLINLSVISI